jgi:predicted transcriptional regulator
MQKYLGIKVDGRVGKETREKLNNSCNSHKKKEIVQDIMSGDKNIEQMKDDLQSQIDILMEKLKKIFTN